MQTTAEILDRFSHLLPYVFSLGLAILFFFAFFLLRKPMVRLLFKIFHRCLRRFHSAQEIIDGVDFVVNPRFEGKPTRKASSIIAFGEGGEVKIIRE